MHLSKSYFRRLDALIILSLLLVSIFAATIFIRPVLGAWWDPGWQSRKAITIDHTKVTADLTDFPILVDITDADLASRARSDGHDIAFVGTVQLKYEREYYSSATGHLVAWVRIPSLSSTVDTTFYMYYENPTASDQQSPTNVWDSNYKMVQHFKESSGTLYDSSTNGRNGAAYNGVVQGTAGKIDGSCSFDGSDDYIQVSGTDVVAGSSNTVSFWEKNMAIGTGYGCIFDDYSGSGGLIWQFGDSSSMFQIGNVGAWSNRLTYTHGGLVDNNWHYFVATLAGGIITLYKDGVSVATQSSSTDVAADGEAVMLMRRSDGHYTTGLMDELEVSSSARSADWIRTSYNNQYSPSSFYSIGAEERAGPAISTPSPADGTTGVSISLSSLSFTLTSLSGHVMDYTVSTSPNIGSGSGTGVGNGVYTVSISGLSHFTTYTWQVHATDGTTSDDKTYTFSTSGLTSFNPAAEGWQYRRKITIDHTKVSAGLTDFPVLIDFIDSGLASHARSDGRDILFMDGSGTANKLSHEIERYSSGRLTAWVRVPSLSATVDTVIYMYYGKPTSSPLEDAAGVWGSNFKMVQHLEETSGAVYDSTSNGISGALVGGVTQNVPGKINGACSLDGSNGYIDFGDVLDITTGGATWSAWIKLDETRIHRLIGKGSTGILLQWYYGLPGPAGTLEIGNVADWPNRASYTPAPQDTSWHYVVGVFDDATSKYKVYLDGGLVASTVSASSLPADNSEHFVVGTGYVHDFFTKGTVDEVCVSNVARSADWIRTCYNNQYSPDTFYSMGIEESTGAPLVSEPSPADGTVDVPVSLSQLSFRLTDYQGDLMSYTVTTSPNIGSGSGTGVGNGVYTVSVSGLSYSTVYTWQVDVTDGTNPTSVTYSFSTQSASMFDPSTQGWQYRKRITVDHTNVYGYLTDFPLLIDVTDPDLSSHARPDGHDILFMNAGGTASRLSHEIEYYNGGHLTAWVRVPILSSTTDTVIYMYYGKPTATSQENAAGVWDSNFMMVQHLKEASGTVHDSTSNGISGAPVGGVTQNVAGKVDGAAWFNGVNGYIDCGDVLDITTGGATWSAWIRFDEAKVHRFIGKGNNGLLVQWFRSADGTCELQAGNIGDWSNRAVYQQAQDTNWHLVTVVFDDATNKYKLYLDGNPVAEGPSASSLPADNSESFLIGYGYTLEIIGYTKGTIDEVEVSSTARSPGWIRTCYNNQYNPAGFYALGPEEGAGAPLVSEPSPADGAVNVATSLSQLSFRLTDYQGDLMSYTVTTSPNIGSGSGTGVGNGVYTIPVADLSHATTYTWHVNATDGTYWANLTYSFTTRPTIMLSNPSPPEGGVRVSLNPPLSITVDHELDYPMTITFSTNSTGTWQEIYTYTTAGNGIYTAVPEGMTGRNTQYHWSVYASDAYGHSTLQYYTLNIVNYVGQLVTPIGHSFCCRFGYIRPAKEEGQFIATWQNSTAPMPGTEHDNPEYAIYDIDQGWIETYAPVFEDGTGSVYHNFWGYWDGQYHYLDGMGGTTFEVADSPTWEGFRSMNFSTASYTVGPRTWTNPTASTYSFNDTHAWIIASDYYEGGGWVMRYWPWSKASGWGSPVSVLATVTSDILDAGQLLQLSRTNWLLYYADVSTVQIKYVQTTDGGQTWTGPYTCPELTTTSSSCNRISFARYGDNYYIFITDSNGNPTIYNSTDGMNWANKQVVLPVSGLIYHGTLLHQSALISTMSDTTTGDSGVQRGIITVVPEMLSNPSAPSDPYPANGAVLPKGTTTTTLEVTVHGSQTYNVAFYWANGTFIGEDRILKEGDTARVQVTTAAGSACSWYAVARGATFDYCGNEPQTTSDERRTGTYAFTVPVTNRAPTIDSYTPASSTPSVNEGQALAFSQTSHDPDGDPLTYAWLLDSVQQSSAAGWTYTPDYSSAGLHNVTLVVSDGSLTATQQWSVTVINVDQAPIIDYYDPLTSTPSINTGQALVFSQTSHDPDGDPLTYAWLLDSVQQSSTQNWTYTPDYASTGLHNVTLVVSDGFLTATHQWSVTVVLVLPPTPGINFGPQTVTCRKVNETFSLQINITNAVNVEDFAFEIHYDTTLLNYTSVAWNAWGSGSITVNEELGIITGSTSGSLKTGNFALVTMTFKASYSHIWKAAPGWTNDLTGTIYFQSVSVSYPGIPDYGYVRGGLNQVNVGPDATYRFSPIQGDVNNDGTVDISDLRTVAAYYNAKTGDANWPNASQYDLNGDGIIDIFDLVIVARNYDYAYP